MSNPFDLDDFEPAPPYPGQTSVRAEPPYLAGLNEEQRQAARSLDGPVLVLAGAGTGKTRVLTTRLANLIDSGKAAPWQVLVVTFTNKAAREMRERTEHLLGQPIGQMWLGTFHAMGARMLRRHAELVGLKSNFTILDPDDQLRLFKQVIEAQNLDEKRWPARQLAGLVDRLKDRGLTPDKVSANEAGDFGNGKLVDLYRAYQRRLLELNACDFGDLLLHGLTILQSRPDVLEQYHRQFRYIFVDEYQDSNIAQYLWLRILAQGHKNICCVGDDDQSIYGWRGAEVGNILKFEQDFPNAQIIRLEKNYRSTGHILATASQLIANNRGRLGKTLWTDDELGQKVKIHGVWDGDEEARLIGDEIETQQRRGASLAQMAILVRASFQTRAFEERFLTLGLPYKVIGGLRFYERLEIRDAMAYLRVIAQPDDDLAFERIINKPKRKIGDRALQTLHALARDRALPLTQAAQQLVASDELPPQARKSLQQLLGQFDLWRRMIDVKKPAELCEQVLDESGYTQMWQLERTPEAQGRLENLKELVRALEEFDRLAGFLEHVSLVMENEQNQSNAAVSLMTLHGAKGLEFDHVFLPGWEEGLFPHQRAMDESGLKGLEEERRLAYVGITRARKNLHISHAANRRVHGLWQSALPSRFLQELPEEHIEQLTKIGSYGSGYGQGWASARRQFDDTPDPFSAQSTAKTWNNKPMGQPYQRPNIHQNAALAAKPHGFKVGDRVFHLKFGHGTVEEIDHDKLEIEFDKAGRKLVVASFVSAG